ncbi:penicillin-binding protein 2 [Luteibaculum oceani]|uniref:Penicillin-binding protein 2 n=1 Tax=Luteibaculum oceani TaxID=1294296 RepID=A0A5C6UQJ2_9FLAO|nr:penicillin-binding protein 2 [Luteibaculum oceani]TXC75612.1 penicillin-binding protein 2 [Luteibaculum oceani]
MSNYSRRPVLLVLFVLIGFIFLVRLFFLQVVDNSWKAQAASMSERRIIQYPARGIVFDRNGEELVTNIPVYDLMVLPRDLEPMDTALFCDLVGVSKEDFIKRIKAAKAYSYRKASIFEKQIPAGDYGKIAEQLYQFPGFYGQSRTLRTYPQRTAAHVLGYIGEVSGPQIERNPYYKKGDYVGYNGIEKYYEEVLRGERGVNYVVVDVHNNTQGSYKDGLYDTLPRAGENIYLSLDAELQQYTEKLLQGKRGAVVAIEPSTGEILALANNPKYDPNLLIGRVRSKNYNKLLRDTLKPLFNRALMSRYPPGSTFKLINGLIGLQEGVIDPNTSFRCRGGYFYPGGKVGCHDHSSPVRLNYSITTSCNAYYCNVFKNLMDNGGDTEANYKKWRTYLSDFGLGKSLGIDLPSENSGFIPETTYYDKFYGRNRWKGLTIISLAIGQGEIGISPVQMANMCATIANRGYYITPHFIKKFENNPDSLPEIYTQKNKIDIDSTYWELVVDGMENVVLNGTGRRAHFSDSISVCGKTGTAQNPHGKDHSIFIAFAPKGNPKIAVAVYVENVGFGSTWAAPIASLTIEKYLTRKITRKTLEDRMFNADLL